MAELDLHGTLLHEPHHDGSELYVLERPDALGGEAVVRIRVSQSVDEILVRYLQNGEPRSAVAEHDGDGWWVARFPVTNPDVRYRWLLSGGELGYAWLNGTGLVTHDIPDSDDFVMSVDPGGPGWHAESVVYEIFPDRFANSGLDVEPPEWAIPRDWDELPIGRGPETAFEWFGGDLRGIEQHLDHIEQLGANVIYLTPIFPAGSTHRYDSTTFDQIDPLLGGNEALESLVRAAHARGMRVVSDLTTNHTGDKHEWFLGGNRDLYLFDANGDYESWWGIKSLPKLNWLSSDLRARIQDVARKWLQEPYGLDGWRVDVANMSGRTGATDVNADVAPTLREVLDDGSVLVAENFHDYRADFRGWHGAMNYAGFSKPVWGWLRRDGVDYVGMPVPMPLFRGDQVVATMRAFRAGVPWQFSLHSWALLDSHDSPRFRTLAGSRERQLVGVGLQMTTPGVPMVFAGDELGLEGEWGEDARRTMPWDRPETWDAELHDEYRRLIALRQSSGALARGGMRFAYVDDDVIAYLRETRDERLLCLASRGDHEAVRLSLAALEADELETLHGVDAVIESADAVLPATGPSFHVWRLTSG
ncbi:MAG: glycoside hydrolase family 13 protein [Actinobacteria bacterium]|nr:glycoside hydrolase family 13 protein [Actinomycetota bacterium]